MNKQEELWAGEFGDEYESRNWPDEEGLRRREKWLTELWVGPKLTTKGLRAQDIGSILEVGAGSGFNLSVLGALSKWWVPGRELRIVGTGVNQKSMSRMEEAARLVGGPVPDGVVAPARDLFAFPDSSYDLVMTCGLLIHIPPEDLPAVYSEIWRVTKKLVLIAEYFSPEPRQVLYRGRKDVLWTRDFGGEMLAAFPSARVVASGHEFEAMGGYDDLAHWIFQKAV